MKESESCEGKKDKFLKELYTNLKDLFSDEKYKILGLFF